MDTSELSGTKCYQILQAMPVEMRNRFADFMHSPYCNKRPQMTALFDILRDILENRPPAKPQKSWIYQQVVKSDPQKNKSDEEKDKHLRTLFSDLKELEDRFLTMEAFAEDPHMASFYLCKSYLQLQLPRLFELQIHKAIDALPLETATAPRLAARFALETLQYENRVASLEWKKIETLPGDALILHFHIERYKQLCEGVLFERLNKRQLEAAMGKALPEVIPATILHQYPYAKFYSDFYALLTGDNGDFDALLKFLRDDRDRIDRDELRAMYIYLQNYCSGKLHDKDNVAIWRKQLLAVYRDQMALQDDILIRELTNRVTVAVKENDLATADMLYEEGLKRLVADPDDTMRHYLEAYMLYAHKDYGKARKKLKDLHPSDAWDELSVRILEIKTWWESGDQDEDKFTLSLIDKLIRSLKRNSKLTAKRSKVLIEGFKAFKSIIQIRSNRKALLAKREEYENDKDLPDRDYILERIHAYLAT